MKNLVIVESPAKAKTIEKFLGKDYTVKSSYGHIRDLAKKEMSIDVENDYEPQYQVSDDKRSLVNELQKAVKSADKVWLASDEDREGEAIAWHLQETLKLNPETTQRIVFNEITKTAILHAIENPRGIDMNLVNAQQARRVLDRLVGYEISPILWSKIKPALSAGRVQSVAVRLIVERENEIKAFESKPYFRVLAQFRPVDSTKTLAAELNRHFETETDAQTFLESVAGANFKVSKIETKPAHRTPAPPFTTSTLQQEASRKLGFSVARTMQVAQQLYESGYITYMRTDSVNLSELALSMAKKEIESQYGAEYVKTRRYQTKTKGAQEAHEAIRPTDMTAQSINAESAQRRLYELIWKRTVASQMADAEIEKTEMEISIQGEKLYFQCSGEQVKFDGFLKVYMESTDDDEPTGGEKMLPRLPEGTLLSMESCEAEEHYTQHPPRYTEASLVKKLEDLGIGRPSTYAPTISTILKREYIMKEDREGEERNCVVLTLKGDQVKRVEKKEKGYAEKGKLFPTDIGCVVNDFLMEHFDNIMDYNFTATVEKEFDKIAEGKEEWADEIGQFYKHFEPEVEKVMNSRSAHKAGERELGKDPDSGKPVFVKIGKFGPVIQIGSADDSSKPRFAQLPADKSMEDITLDEALELFRLPRNLGEFEGEYVRIGTGRFGPYILHNKKYVSLPKDEDPLTVSLETAIRLIEEKRSQEQKRHLKTFDEDQKLEVMNGRFGPYVVYDGANYRLPKAMHERAAELTYEECMEIVRSHPATTKQRKKR